MTTSQLVPAIVFPFIAWRVYSRVRRNIGRQRLQRRRLIATIVIFSVIGLLIGLGALTYPPSLAGLGGGLLLGAPLALLGLRLTRFETAADGDYYTPNTYLGLTLTFLFVGRMIYRIIVLAQISPESGPPPSLFHSPLTLLMFGLTVGYYIAYYAGVLRHTHKPAA